MRRGAELSRDMDYEIARPKTRVAAVPGWLAGVLSPLRYALIIARKDVATELRTKEIFTATFIFALLSIVIFNFAFDLKGLDAKAVAPGMLWVAFIFAGVLGLNRSIIMEKDRGCLDGLLLCPVSRESIFLGKMVGNIIFMGAMEVVTYPIFAIFSNLPIWAPTLVPIIALGTIGFAAVGTLFSAMAVNTRTREVMLPVLLFPVAVPVVIAAVKATGVVMSGGNWELAFPWVGLLAAYDIIFVVVSILVFEFIVEE